MHIAREEASQMTTHVLIVEDEALLRRSVTFNLEQAGFRVSAAATAETALAMARRDAPDVVLLDIGLPGMDGLDALRVFRNEFSVPVIFVTARRRELDQVVGLELGADDYVTKPFDFNVLLARINAVMRRVQAGASPKEKGASGPISVGNLVIDPEAYVVTVDGRAVQLSTREFDLLHVLAMNQGKVVSVDDLLGQVWGAEYIGEPQVVYVHIRWLREKLESDPGRPSRILTVRSKGYKLVEPSSGGPEDGSQEVVGEGMPGEPEAGA